MLEMKLVQGKDVNELNIAANAFLRTLKDDSVQSVTTDIPNLTITILFRKEEKWETCYCSDCQYWDDGASSDAVIGLCHERGGRKRFNCKACESFKDIRG